MPQKKTPAPEEPAAPKPKRTRKAKAAAGKKAHAPAQAAPASVPPILPEDRELMGEAIVPIVERDGPLLLALARESFSDLTPLEERFFRNLGIVVYGNKVPDEKDEENILRADRLAWVLLDLQALQLMTPLGVMVGGANIIGKLDLIYCQANLCLKLDACSFDEDIMLMDSRFALISLEGSRCIGLHADRIEIRGGVFLRHGSIFQGEVRFLGATIGADLSCNGSAFLDKNGKSLSADGINIYGSILLGPNALFKGEVRLLGATIGGDLLCSNTNISNDKGDALFVDAIKVDGNVLLRDNVFINGTVDFTNAKINGGLILKNMHKDTSWSLRLCHAKVEVLWDDQESWPEQNELWLDGFSYSRLDEKAVWDLDARLDWLSRHSSIGKFNPQPYEQLAKVYREAGFEREAREVLIAKHWRWLEQSRCGLPALGDSVGQWPGWPSSWGAVRPWLRTTLPVWLGKAARPCRDHAGKRLAWLHGKICAFGYKPWRAAGWWAGVWAFTWLLVSRMAVWGWLVPTMVDQQAGTNIPISFTSSGFSFDLLTPIFDMGYLAAWTPANNVAALILLVLGTAGYILVALFAASITGLIRK